MPCDSNGKRCDQLSTLATLAQRLIDPFGENGELQMARAFNDLALAADALLRDGFDQDALNRVSSTMPGPPDWLNPRYLDFNGERAPWQDEVAPIYSDCWHAALDLRTIGER